MGEVPGTGSGTSGIYDEDFTVGVGGLPIDSIITLPSAGEYEDKDLQVHLRGQYLAPGVDYEYVGVAPRTQIKMIAEALLEGDTLNLRVEGNAGSIFDETIIIGVGGLVAGSMLTLPSSKEYFDIDLKLYLGGQLLAVVEDYNYVGASPRTQIQTVFDLLEDERVRFRIEG